MEQSQPILSFCHFRGGGAFALKSIMLAAVVENAAQQEAMRLEGRPIYLRDLFEGGIFSSSGGVFPALAASISHPDDAARPLFTMEEFTKQFINHLPQVLPFDHNDKMKRHGTQLMRSLLFNSLEQHNIDTIAHKGLRLLLRAVKAHTKPKAGQSHSLPQIDKTYTMEAIKSVFGDITLDQLPVNFVATATRMDADNWPSFNFSHLPVPFLKNGERLESITPTPQAKLTDIVLSTMAFPYVYGAHKSEFGLLSDYNHVFYCENILAEIKAKTSTPQAIGFVSFGNLDPRPQAIDHKKHGTFSGIFEQSVMATLNSVKNNAEQTLRYLVEPPNLHLLRVHDEFTGKSGKTYKFNGSPALMLTTPEQVEHITTHCQNYIDEYKDELEQVGIMLARNTLRREFEKSITPPAAQPQHQDRPHFWQRFFKTKQPA